MGFHTFDADRADKLEDVSRFRYCSRDELVAHLAVDEEAVVADLGSGTGFYTDEVAPFVGSIYAVDVQSEMHDYYRSKGVPENVDLITSDIESLPFETGELDGAFSTMTFHEFVSPESLRELHRVTAEGGRVAVVDWTAQGTGDAGPPLDERYDAAVTTEKFHDADFDVVHSRERPDTFVVVAEV
jgi:ubiquinone/menaquinone biosynthesis C-methylase UbiE